VVTDIADHCEKIQKGHTELVCINAEVFTEFNALWYEPKQA